LAADEGAVVRELARGSGKLKLAHDLRPRTVPAGARGRRGRRGGERGCGGASGARAGRGALRLARRRGSCERGTRGPKGQHAQQRHLKATARVGSQGQVAAADDRGLVVQLYILARQRARQTLQQLRRVELVALVVGKRLLESHAHQERGELVEHLRVVGREFLEGLSAAQQLAAVGGGQQLRDIVLFTILAIVAVGVIIYIQEGQRRIPVQYASRVRGRRMYQGGQTFLPLRVNLAGVIPIIFAISILQFPAQLALYFSYSTVEGVKNVATAIANFLSSTTPQYAIMYFLLTIGFTYFYTAFTFKPDETAEQLRKNGGFIPGIRPGRPTQDYLARVVSRITIAGALFLGTIAVAPVIAGVLDPSLRGVALGGTGILIVVSVVVETMKQIEAQLMMRNYEGFIR